MRSETYEPPALGEYVHDPRAVPARLGTNFSDVLESKAAPKGEFIPTLRMHWPKGTSPSIINGSWKPPAVVKVN
jgi:hypothetical protein